VLFNLPVVDIQKKVEDYLVKDNQHLNSTIEYNQGMIGKLNSRKKYLDTEIYDICNPQNYIGFGLG
jgi:hypothetical protein